MQVHEKKKKTGQTLNRPTCKCVCIVMTMKGHDIFCGHNILTGVFLSQLSNNAGISR
jgi:hypothetical protein